ncbi:MAG: hypothetical protein OXQ92_14750 [Boseongicola sp.]|nr:hypothetical protein [Boseongicola sp.]MDD9977874.1 hypothetical protein [Boseongicola sp.]
MSQIEALTYVCVTSLAELKSGVAALEDADSRTIDARLRNLEATASTLSSGLDKLSKWLDELPPEHPDSAQKGPVKPVDDGGLLLRAAQKLGELLDAHSSFGDHGVVDEK